MAKQSVSQRNDFMNFLRFRVAESAAATFTQNELDTNLSAERGVIMEIHSIELLFEGLQLLTEVGADATESVVFQLTRESKTAPVVINDADLILRRTPSIMRSSAVGTDAGPIYVYHDQYVRTDFPKPIPYVKPTIFAAVVGTDASGLQAVSGRIGYTLREVSRSEFIELLVALQ